MSAAEYRAIAGKSLKKAKGKTKKRIPGEMNSLEYRYSQRLDAMKIAGEIADYAFERITLKLANRTTYTPDFMVMTNDGFIEFHETKGFMRDDANVKLKVAANAFPWFDFYLVKESKGIFDIKAVSA